MPAIILLVLALIGADGVSPVIPDGIPHDAEGATPLPAPPDGMHQCGVKTYPHATRLYCKDTPATPTQQ